MHKRISYGGMGCALCVILLAMASYLPTGRAATLFLASLLSYVMCFAAGKKTALIMYGAASALSMLIFPGGSLGIVISYVICFGNYPILKTIIDAKPLGLQIIFKLVLYGIYFAVVYAVFKLIINQAIPYAPVLLFLGGIFVFAFYDYLILYTGRYIDGFLHK